MHYSQQILPRDLTFLFNVLYMLKFIIHTLHNKLLTTMRIDEVLVYYRWQGLKQTVLLIWTFLVTEWGGGKISDVFWNRCKINPSLIQHANLTTVMVLIVKMVIQHPRCTEDYAALVFGNSSAIHQTAVFPKILKFICGGCKLQVPTYKIRLQRADFSKHFVKSTAHLCILCK